MRALMKAPRQLTCACPAALPADARVWAVGAAAGGGQAEPGRLCLGHPAALCGELRSLCPLWFEVSLASCCLACNGSNCRHAASDPRL